MIEREDLTVFWVIVCWFLCWGSVGLAVLVDALMGGDLTKDSTGPGLMRSESEFSVGRRKYERSRVVG